MTCIVGIVHDGRITLGCDSAGVDGAFAKQIRADRKIFRNGELIFGFTSSFRMGQLLEHALTPPEIHEGRDPYAYCVRSLIPAVRDTLRAGGWLKTEHGREEAGTFLVGFRGRLFAVYADLQVAESVEAFAAVGCGEAYAMGAMYAAKEEPIAPGEPVLKAMKPTPPLDRLRIGLEAAAHFSAGVAPPFHFLTLEPRS